MSSSVKYMAFTTLNKTRVLGDAVLFSQWSSTEQIRWTLGGQWGTISLLPRHLSSVICWVGRDWYPWLECHIILHTWPFASIPCVLSHVIYSSSYLVVIQTIKAHIFQCFERSSAELDMTEQLCAHASPQLEWYRKQKFPFHVWEFRIYPCGSFLNNAANYFEVYICTYIYSWWIYIID